MKNNFQWILESTSRIHNVQTFLNGRKSTALHKHDGACRVLNYAEKRAFEKKLAEM